MREEHKSDLKSRKYDMLRKKKVRKPDKEKSRKKTSEGTKIKGGEKMIKDTNEERRKARMG